MTVTITSNGNAPVAKAAKKKATKAQLAAAAVRTAARAKEKALKDKAKALADKELAKAHKAKAMTQVQAKDLLAKAGRMTQAAVFTGLENARKSRINVEALTDTAETNLVCFYLAKHGTNVLLRGTPEYVLMSKGMTADRDMRMADEACPIRRKGISDQFGTVKGRMMKKAAQIAFLAGLPISKEAAKAMQDLVEKKGGNKGRKANKLKEAKTFHAFLSVIVPMVAGGYAKYEESAMGFAPKTELDNVVKNLRAIGLAVGVNFDSEVDKAQAKSDK
jgi:hypothetical protein